MPHSSYVTSLALNGLVSGYGDLLVIRAVPSGMDRCYCRAQMLLPCASARVALSLALSCSLVLHCCLSLSSMARHNTEALTRCQRPVPGPHSPQSHETNKPVLYKLPRLVYSAAEVESGRRQYANHGSVFILFGHGIASPHSPPVTFHPFPLSQHTGSWLCPQHASYIPACMPYIAVSSAWDMPRAIPDFPLSETF